MSQILSHYFTSPHAGDMCRRKLGFGALVVLTTCVYVRMGMIPQIQAFGRPRPDYNQGLRPVPINC